MFATEEHAKENWWCPNAIIPVQVDARTTLDDPLNAQPGSTVKIVTAANRSPYTPDGIHDLCKCVGTKCAYWRWKNMKETVGFCGKAGRPVD